jgi:hypothetical protein
VGGSLKTTTFHVHHNLLIAHSKFFRYALDSQWRTDVTKPIALIDTRPAYFELYAQWLYSKRLPRNNLPGQFARLYVLGERIEDEAFKRVVLASMRRNTAPCLTTTRMIYQNTTVGSLARPTVADSIVRNITPAIWKPWELDLTTDGELMLGILTALLTQLPLTSQWPERTATPQYHIGVTNMTRYNAILDSVRVALRPDAQPAMDALFTQVKSINPLHDCEFMIELFGAQVEWRGGNQAVLQGLRWRGIWGGQKPLDQETWEERWHDAVEWPESLVAPVSPMEEMEILEARSVEWNGVIER